MKCPVCNTKIPKKTGLCPNCGFRVPPEPSFFERISFIPLPMLFFALVMVAGILLLVYRFAQPSDYKEPIVSYQDEIEIESNVGIVFFDNAENELINQVYSAIEILDIDSDCEIKYKYNTDGDCYEKAIDSLVNDSICKNIIIAGKENYDILRDLASRYPDIRFFVLWGSDEFIGTPPENVQICRVDISKAVHSIGINSAHRLTEVANSADVIDTVQSGINHSALFLYKTDYGYSLFEQFAAGVKQISPNLNTYAVKVDDETAYAKELAESGDVYAIMVADEMPELTKALSEISSDKIYLSGIGEDVTGYSNYLCAITVDYDTYINYIFNTIADGGSVSPIFEGTYDDSFCRLKYNTNIKADQGVLR